eukprot:UN04845
MHGGMFTVTIILGVFGMIGIWMIMKATEKIRKNYLLSKYPISAKGIINDKYTNKHNKTSSTSHSGHVYYIEFSFCATDRNYATYTISKQDHQMLNKYEWMNVKVGDVVEIVYCAKDITLFALTSEQGMSRTQCVPIAVIFGSIPFLLSMFIPLFLGQGIGTASAIMIAATGGMVMKVQKMCCCDIFYQKCKKNNTVMNVVSEVATFANSPELEVPSGSDDDSLR